MKEEFFMERKPRVAKARYKMDTALNSRPSWRTNELTAD